MWKTKTPSYGLIGMAFRKENTKTFDLDTEFTREDIGEYER